MTSWGALWNSVLNVPCRTIPINGISGGLHVLGRLTQVKQQLELVSQNQVVPLQFVAKELNKISWQYGKKKQRVNATYFDRVAILKIWYLDALSRYAKDALN